MNKLYSALEQYDLQNKTATLLGHNENMAFNVADLFLLRIHQSAEIFCADFLYDGLNRKDVYNTEMLFLQHLKCCGMDVQIPVADKYGNLVSSIDDMTFVTMLSWLDGKSADKSDLSAEFCTQYGKLVAQLHNSSKTFRDTNILKYNDRLCDVLLSQFCTAYKEGCFSEEQYSILTKICGTIKSAFAEYEKDYVVVHGDLSLSNTIITSSGLALIDFSLFGYGHPMLDVACAYSFITDNALRENFDNGYCSGGGSINRAMLNVCYAFNELIGILLHINKLVTETWFINWLDGLCTNIFIPVINKKEPIWTELNG